MFRLDSDRRSPSCNDGGAQSTFLRWPTVTEGSPAPRNYPVPPRPDFFPLSLSRRSRGTQGSLPSTIQCACSVHSLLSASGPLLASLKQAVGSWDEINAENKDGAADFNITRGAPRVQWRFAPRFGEEIAMRKSAEAVAVAPRRQLPMLSGSLLR